MLSLKFTGFEFAGQIGKEEIGGLGEIGV